MDNNQIIRDAWREQAIRAYKAKRFEECLNLLASNMRDRGDVEDMIDAFCSEADPIRRTF